MNSKKINSLNMKRMFIFESIWRHRLPAIYSTVRFFPFPFWISPRRIFESKKNSSVVHFTSHTNSVPVTLNWIRRCCAALKMIDLFFLHSLNHTHFFAIGRYAAHFFQLFDEVFSRWQYFRPALCSLSNVNIVQCSLNNIRCIWHFTCLSPIQNTSILAFQRIVYSVQCFSVAHE